MQTCLPIYLSPYLPISLSTCFLVYLSTYFPLETPMISSHPTKRIRQFGLLGFADLSLLWISQRVGTIAFLG